jgi:hypothetical protein
MLIVGDSYTGLELYTLWEHIPQPVGSYIIPTARPVQSLVSEVIKVSHWIGIMRNMW